MSEYQYYEFLSVDRPLSDHELAELRALSTRAVITPTRFSNVYNWGNFRGDPMALMQRYYDAFIYVANWGSHQFMVRLPKSLLDVDTVKPFCNDISLFVQETDQYVIVTFASDDDGESGWVSDEESEGWMPALILLRADLAMGDLRCLYLAWLAGAYAQGPEYLGYEQDDGAAEEGDESNQDAPEPVDGGVLEPPVPPGLGNLSAPLRALADFLRVDDDLLAVAAESSAPTDANGTAHSTLKQWIAALAETEKNELLLQLLESNNMLPRAEIMRRQRAETAARSSTEESEQRRRSVEQLLAEAEKHGVIRKREEARRAAEEKAQRQREEALARNTYLDQLRGHEDETWELVETLLAAKKAKEYDSAVQLLVDLRDLSVRMHRQGDFAARMREVRDQHQQSRALMQRLKKAKLAEA